jgi:hypothetical protein
MNLPVEIMSPFAQIGQIYCPNVYRELINENPSNQSSKLLFTNINIILFCLFLSFLCIFIFILTGQFLSYFPVVHIIILAIRHKYHPSSR